MSGTRARATRRSRSRASRDLRGELTSSFRWILGAIGISILLSAALGFAAVGIFEGKIERYVDAREAVARAHEGMLDQETGLRGYLLTGQRAFVQPYLTGRVQVANANQTLADLLAGDRRSSALFTGMRVGEQRWTSEWAEVALERAQDSHGTSARFLTEGKRLFDAYRATEDELSAALDSQIVDVEGRERIAFLAAGIVEVLFLLGVAGYALSQRRRLREDLVGPVEDLLARMQAAEQGDLESPIPVAGPLELRRLGSSLHGMTDALRSARAKGEEREAEMAFRAGSLRRLLTLVRDFTSTLDPAEVMATIGDGAKSVAGFAHAGVWILDGSDAPTLAHGDLAAGDGAVSDTLARQAAGTGRIVTRPPHSGATPDEMPRRIALPMIAGGQVIGVLELADPVTQGIPGGAFELFETLAGQAATAIQAARLYQSTEQMSQTDGLTGLLNRRRLDDDLNYELARSSRYGNALTFVLFDLDNFKQFNDTHGHQEGDEVLRDVGRILASSLRRTDSAYRYGGDELAMLLRETPADAGARLANRIRQRIAERFASELPAITASFGVADHVTAGSAEADALVRLADANLYDAKRRGRNQVVYGKPDAQEGAVVRDIRDRR